jgi:Fe-S-cluster containining protein
LAWEVFIAVQQIIGLLRRKVKFTYPPAVRFHCVKCGLCCGDTKEKNRHILLLEPETEQISETVLQPASQFTVKIQGAEPYSYEMKKTETGNCVFLQNNRCTIYEVRPLICRFYPFELKSSHGKNYQFLFTEECPGIGKGRVLGEGYFRKMFRLALAKHWQAEDSS